jgi:hypothetical protein
LPCSAYRAGPIDVIASAAKQSTFPYAAAWIASLPLAMKTSAEAPQAVILCESGGSSTPRLIDSIAAVSEMLGHPPSPSRVTTTWYEFAISRHRN